MLTVLLGLSATILESLWNSFRKKSLDIWKLSNIIFKLYSNIFWILAIPLIVLIYWFDYIILKDTYDLILLFIICLFWTLNILLWLKIYKTTKLSELLPYSNLDKIFIIIIWYFIFYWTNNWSSIYTLFISLLTLIIILLFTTDIRKFRISKKIWLYLVHKVFNAANILLIWYLLTRYSSFTMATMTWLFEFITLIFIWILIKASFKSVITQEKQFYFYRLLTVIFWWSWRVISLVILKEAWVVIATLLWFLGVVFNIISMKFILKDNPTKKQVILSVLVLVLISIWIYFKDY